VHPVGTIRELWRYPVKSMGGERLEAADVVGHGVVGDRQWAVRDEEKAVIAGAKRIPGLLLCTARFVEAPTAEGPPAQVAIRLPDGSEVSSDDPDVHRRLSAAAGRTVTLCGPRPASDGDHYRTPKPTAAEMREFFAVESGEELPDFSMLPASLLAELYQYATPRGTYYDAYTLHILTSASLAAIAATTGGADLDVRRFRPNIVVETVASGLVEVDWCGGTLRAGGLHARVHIPTVRCAMPTRPQPGLRADPSVLKAISEHAGRCLGVYATPSQPGRVCVGDPVEVELPEATVVGRWFKAGATSLKRLALRAAAATLREE